MTATETSPRITIIYSPVGNGHRAAARNIAMALERVRPDADVEVLNVLDFAPGWFRYDTAWTLIQKYGGRLWDRFFDLTDRRSSVPVDRCRQALNLRLLAPLVKHLVARQPDRIVCTHYLPAIAVARLKRTGRLQGQASVVVTDYLSHQAWINSGVDRYYVASRDVARALRARAISRDAIDIAGIPIDDHADAAPVAGPRLMSGRLKVLFLAAGVPRRLVREALRSTAGIEDLELDVVAGGDSELTRLLAGWSAAFGLNARLHGRLPTLKPLMERAHLVVTKAGGLVVSECLGRGRGMVFPWPAPGQERGNRAHALAAGAAVPVDQARLLGTTLQQLARAPGRVVELGMAATRAATRGGADRIARDLARGLPEVRVEHASAARVAVGGRL